MNQKSSVTQIPSNVPHTLTGNSGAPPLGYDNIDKKLVVNEREA